MSDSDMCSEKRDMSQDRYRSEICMNFLCPDSNLTTNFSTGRSFLKFFLYGFFQIFSLVSFIKQYALSSKDIFTLVLL